MTTIRNPRKYGWKPQLPDHRDQVFSAAPGAVPIMKTVRSMVTTVFDQQQEGSCTANSISQAMMMGLKIAGLPVITLSRNFLYYNERVIEGDPKTDGGAAIRDGIKSAASAGVCTESLWPYEQSNMFTKPSEAAYNEAPANKIKSYAAVPQSLGAMRLCLAGGHPFVFGFSVYDSFETDEVANSGNASLPGKDESVQGGHAVCCVGYNSGPQIDLGNSQAWPSDTFLVQNSWGTGWGFEGANAGCFTLPYAYLTNPNLASDFWTIKVVS